MFISTILTVKLPICFTGEGNLKEKNLLLQGAEFPLQEAPNEMEW